MSFEINWANPKPHQAPEQLEGVTQEGISPGYIISRNVDGTVLSQFMHDTWDCRLYGAGSRFVFDSWWDFKTRGAMDSLARTITDEIKLLHWLSGFETTCNAGRSRGTSYLNSLMPTLRSLAKIAYNLGITLTEAHTSSQFQVALRNSIANASPGFAATLPLQGLLKDAAFWSGIETIEVRAPLIIPETEMQNILALTQRKQIEADSKSQQTPLIPTRLYAKLIEGSLEKLRRIEPYLPRIECFIRDTYADPSLSVPCFKNGLYSSGYKNNLSRVKRLYPTRDFPTWIDLAGKYKSLSETVNSYDLSEYWTDAGLGNSLSELNSHIGHLQSLCVLLIHAFTGMRASEVKVMPYEPVIHQAAKGFGDVPVLISHLSKFSSQGNYSKPLVWATSEEGVYAVRIAQQLARLNWYRHHPVDEEIPRNMPLWLSPDANCTNPGKHYAQPTYTALFGTPHARNNSESLRLVIEQSDLDELTIFDAFRNWDENPDFAKGKYWPLSSHQFRRTVAVYASRSGMVSLPTLKTQYKHLSAVMTALYGENSTYAQNFLIDKNGKPIDHGSVLTSFRESVRFNTSVRFYDQVIKSETRLKGPVGSEIQRAKDKGNLPNIYESRVSVEKALKQGRLAYIDTPVGGCTRKGDCPHFGVDIVLPCTRNCPDAILSEDKLEIYLDSLRFDQAEFSPTSRPFKLIASEIDHITKMYLEPQE